MPLKASFQSLLDIGCGAAPSAASSTFSLPLNATSRNTMPTKSFVWTMPAADISNILAGLLHLCLTQGWHYLVGLKELVGIIVNPVAEGLTETVRDDFER
jgi:hypothetical protein